MADHSKIEWTETTWNPVVGCTHVSPGCDNCYAAREASGRLSRLLTYAGLAAGGRFTGEVRLLPERLDQPLRWRRPRRIFVNSMSDLFHEHVPDTFIAEAFALMRMADQHTFQVLTKRHGRMRSLLNSEDFRGQYNAALHTRAPGLSFDVWPVPNIWLGLSVENQQWADIRIPALLDTAAAVRWLSCEPLLGPVSLSRWLGPVDWPECWNEHAPTAECSRCIQPDWIVVGGESGPGARPMHPDWARSLRDQCVAAGVPFFLKQWGEWAPYATHFAADREEQGRWDTYVNLDGTVGEYAISEDHDQATNWTGDPKPGNHAMTRVGKRRAGRELDGRTWDEYPTAVGADA